VRRAAIDHCHDIQRGDALGRHPEIKSRNVSNAWRARIQCEADLGRSGRRDDAQHRGYGNESTLPVRRGDPTSTETRALRNSDQKDLVRNDEVWNGQGRVPNRLTSRRCQRNLQEFNRRDEQSDKANVDQIDVLCHGWQDRRDGNRLAAWLRTGLSIRAPFMRLATTRRSLPSMFLRGLALVAARAGAFFCSPLI